MLYFYVLHQGISVTNSVHVTISRLFTYGIGTITRLLCTDVLSFTDNACLGNKAVSHSMLLL